MSTVEEKEELKAEIESLKQEQKELKCRIGEIERLERLKVKERQNIVGRLKNKDMLDVISEYYDNVYEQKSYRTCAGKVALRHYKYTPQEFTKIRDIAKAITNFPSFSKRSDGYVEQSTVRRNLNSLDDVELDLVTQCADEIIAVLYKYKIQCRKHQNLDLSEFVIEGGGIECN